MIKKNLLFSILIVSISPIFVSTSCKNENKINILENKKMLYTKDILIKNLDNSIKQIRENISNYLKKNNINDIERITKKTDDNYGILPNGQKAKNDVFPWLIDSENNNISTINELYEFLKSAVNSIDLVFQYLNYSDVEKSKYFSYLNAYFNSYLILEIKKITNLIVMKKNGLLDKEIIEKLYKLQKESLNLLNNIKNYFSNEYKKILAKILNKTLENENIKKIHDITNKLSLITNNFNFKFSNNFYSYRNIFNSLWSALKKNINETIKNNEESKILISELQNVFNNVVKEMNNILMHYINFKWIEEKTINEIMGINLSESDMVSDLKKYIKEKIEEIDVNLRSQDISNELLEKIFKSGNNILNNEGYQKIIIEKFVDIINQLKEFNNKWIATNYLKNSLYQFVLSLAKRNIDNQLDNITSFIIEKNKNSHLTYEEYIKNQNNNLLINFNWTSLKKIIDFYWINYSSYGLNKTIMSNEISTIENIIEITNPLRQFNNNYFDTIQEIVKNNNLLDAIKENNILKILQAYEKIKKEWNNRRNEVIDKLKLDSSNKIKFQNKYNIYTKAANELFSILNFKKIGDLFSVEKNILEKIGQL